MAMTVIEMDTMESIQRMAHSVEAIKKAIATPREIDWEQRRYEIAKDLLAAQMTDGAYSVTSAVRIADKLIEELKKQN